MRAAVPADFHPFIEDPQALALVLTTGLYGVIGGLMLLRVRWKYGHGIGLLPRERFERWLWLVCVPLLVVWILMPGVGLVLERGHTWLLMPEFVRHNPMLFWMRWLAAAGAMLSLLVVIGCWRRMGQSWRIAVIPGEKTALVTDGLYATIRHPIYAFTIVLVLCSMVIVPTIPMVLVATSLIVFMLVKAHHEERFMRETHGQIYVDYCKRTGRFFPRRGFHREAQ